MYVKLNLRRFGVINLYPQLEELEIYENIETGN